MEQINQTTKPTWVVVINTNKKYNNKGERDREHTQICLPSSVQY